MNIDISKLPKLTFKLKKLDKAAEILKTMRDNNIEGYVYAFEYMGIIMKYGVQYQAGDGHGNRIYRQAFHIPGWEKPCSPNMSGDDMRDIINEHFPSIHKDHVTIHVWDMTNYPQTILNDHKFDINMLERQFIKEHIEKHGRKPLGNIKDEEHMDKKCGVLNAVFNNLFEEI